MSCGSWGVELWDQSENLLKYSNEQVSSVDVYFHLFSEIQKLQYDFGKRLRKMVATFQKKKPPSSEDFTYSTSFYRLVQTLTAVGSVFESSANELGEHVVGSFKQLYENERKDLDNRRGSLSRLNQNMDQLRKQLDATWQKYVAAYKDRQKSYDNFTRAEKELAPARVDQLKDLYMQKRHGFDQLKAQYASELNKYNSGLRQHYNKGLTEYLDELSLKSRSRIERTKDLLQTMTKINEDMCQKLSDCVRSIQDTVATMDSVKDDELVISRFRSGEYTPVDLPFLDLDHCPLYALEGSSHSLGSFMLGIEPSQPCGQLPGSSATVSSSGLLSGFKRGSTKGSREEYANLRSPFVCDISSRSLKDTDFTIIQLTERLRDFSDQIKRTEAEIEGTQRLLDAYRENPTLGDPVAVEPKIGMLKRRLFSLQEHVSQLEKRYAQMGGDQGLRDAQEQREKVQSVATESGTRSLLSVPRVSTPDSDYSDFSDTECDVPNSNRRRSSDSNPVVPKASTAASGYVGFATMKYEYEGFGSQCLAAKPGDSFYVVKLDTDGSGWTSVVSQDGSRSGLVPTEYIDLTKY